MASEDRPKRPSDDGSALHKQWIEYAVRRGIDPLDAEATWPTALQRAGDWDEFVRQYKKFNF